MIGARVAAAFIALLVFVGSACHQTPPAQNVGGVHVVQREGGAPKGSLIVALPRSTWIQIDEQTISAGTTYTSPTWAAGTYRFLRFNARCTASGGNATITLTGLSGTYDGGIIFTTGAGAPTAASNAAWLVGLTAGSNWSGEIDIRVGANRAIQSISTQVSTTTRGLMNGGNNDTTHDVTGFVMTLAASGTFTVTLMGMP